MHPDLYVRTLQVVTYMGVSQMARSHACCFLEFDHTAVERPLFTNLHCASQAMSNNHRRYYAVRIGREGSRIYDNYTEVRSLSVRNPFREPLTWGLSSSLPQWVSFWQLFSAPRWVLNCVIQTLGFSGSSGKGFDNIHDAQEWLTGFQFQVGLPPVTTIHTSKYFPELVIERSAAEQSSSGLFCLRVGSLDINFNINAGSSSTSTTTFTAPQQAFSNDSFRENNQMQEVSRERVEVKNISSPLPVEEPSVELSDEQKNVLKLVKSGRNIFFTGPAGETRLRIVHEDQHIHHCLQVQESQYYSEP